MSVLTVTTPYVDGGTVTSTNLNALVGTATFAAASVDNITTEVSGGSIVVRDAGITESKLSANLQGIIEKIGTAYIGGDKTGNARGTNALDLQTTRVAGATYVASGNNSVAIGTNMIASGTDSIAIGTNCQSEQTNSMSIGRLSKSDMGGAIAIGNSVRCEHATNVQSMALGTSTVNLADRSMAIGNLVFVGDGSSSGTNEIGAWSVDPVAGGRFAGGAGNSIRMHYNGQIAFSMESSATAPVDGGALEGSEPDGSLPREMFAIQKDGDAVSLYFNDSGTIKSLSLGTLS
jgi:hypothetical protein